MNKLPSKILITLQQPEKKPRFWFLISQFLVNSVLVGTIGLYFAHRFTESEEAKRAKAARIEIICEKTVPFYANYRKQISRIRFVIEKEIKIIEVANSYHVEGISHSESVYGLLNKDQNNKKGMAEYEELVVQYNDVPDTEGYIVAIYVLLNDIKVTTRGQDLIKKIDELTTMCGMLRNTMNCEFIEYQTKHVNPSDARVKLSDLSDQANQAFESFARAIQTSDTMRKSKMNLLDRIWKFMIGNDE